MRRARRVACTAVGVLASGAVSIAAVAQNGNDGAKPSPPGIASLVGALGQARSTEDVLPGEAWGFAEGAFPGIAPGEAVRARSAAGRWTFYLIPASEGACVSLVDAVGGSSVSCETAAAIKDGSGAPGAVMTGCEGPPPEVAPPTCDRILLYGIVPDGVEEVAVEVRSGDTARAAVVNNVYAVDVAISEGPTSLRYSSGPGSVTQAIPY